MPGLQVGLARARVHLSRYGRAWLALVTSAARSRRWTASPG